MPDAEEFWNRRADGYAKRPVKDQEGYERTLDATRRHLRENDRVLEVGCGTGTTALLLAPGVEQITASDLSTRMIEIARDKAAAGQVENIRFVHATLFDRILEKESFDAVLAFNVLHLLEDMTGAVRRIHALLTPGGRFISKTVCLADQSRLWSGPLAVMRALRLAPFVRCLKAAELEGALTGAGFEIIEADLHSASPPSCFLVARKA